MWSPATFVPWKRLPSSPRLHITDHSTLVADDQIEAGELGELAGETALLLRLDRAA